MVEAECEFMFPFGKGNRLIQGIVVDVVVEQIQSEELKARRGIRLHSSLKSRAVLVGRSIAKSVFSYKITILKPCFLTSLIPVVTRFCILNHLWIQLSKRNFCEKNEVSFFSRCGRSSPSDAVGPER